MEINTNEELGKAIKDGEDTIEFEETSEAGKTTRRIKATGKVAWAVCIGFFTVAILLILAAPATGGASAAGGVVFSIAGAPAVVGILGMPTVVGAITIAVAGGGVGVLNKLRRYKMEEKNGKIILLKK